VVKNSSSRSRVHSVVLAAALVTMVFAVLGAGSAAARPTPSAFVVTGVPAHVAVGQPIVLTLWAKGVSRAAAFESGMFFDESAAHLAEVQKPTAAALARGDRLVNLGPLEVPNGYLFGSYTCAAANCAAAAHAPVSVSGKVALARIALRADKPGPLAIRFAGIRLVDSSGKTIPTGASNRLVTIHVSGAGGVAHRAPAAPASPPHHAAANKPILADVTGDGRVTEADVAEAALKWNIARMDHSICGDPQIARGLDTNRDGCLDVSDVQSFATAVSKLTLRSVQSQSAASVATVNSPLVVNSTGDGSDASPGNGVCATSTGTCTLRAAINEANARSGADTINFNIAGTGVQTIQLASALPTLSDTTGGTTIDGYTQPGAAVNTSPLADNAQIKIQIRGTGASGVDGIMITSANNVLRGLAFYNLRRVLYFFHSGSNGNTVTGCFVGTDAGGTFGHTVSDTYATGIAIEAGAHNNAIGETTLAGRNVISGNSRHGIDFYNEGSNNNTVYNNIIGLSPLGDRRLQNLKHGIDINAGSSFNLIGGTGTLQRNVISGNGLLNDPDGPAGVEISHATTTTGNQIVGNFFGTDVTGASALSYTYNGLWGIHVEDGSNHSIISDNVVVNSKGGAIKLQDPGTTANVIRDNRIGLTATGQAGPNSGYGVFIAHSAVGNTVGPGNIITNNPVGVWVSGDDTDRNTITHNSIYGNSNLGIDLDPSGQVNPNDPGDLDTGANEQLNYPEISSASPTSVTGTACGGCTVEVYIADSGVGANGEGKTFVGSATADSGGNFTAAISGVNAGQPLTTTATDSNGNTSEFSENVAATTGTATAPGAPALTSATGGPNDVVLHWTEPSSNGGSTISGYKIYRGTTSGSETLLATVSDVTSYDDLTVSVGTTYFYEVSAVNAAGEGSKSNERSAAATGTGLIVSDRFNRTVAAGWGSADIGGSWNTSLASRTKVSGGKGQIYGWTAGNQDTQTSMPITRADTETLAEVTLDANPTGGTYQPRIVARAQADPRNGYVARLVHSPSGAVGWGLNRTDNAGGTGSISLGSGTLITSGGAGTTWWIRLRVQGTSVSVRFWRNGTTEPSAWTATATDSYYASGTPAAGTYVSTSVTSPFPTIGFESFDVVDLGSSSGPTAPGVPSLTDASAGNASVSLTWSAPSSDGGSAITGYNVYRGTSSGGETLLAALGNVTTYNDNSAANGTTYFYKVAAVNSVGTGSQSNELSATPQAAATAPGAPNLTGATPGDGSVALQWSAPGNGGSAITNYKVYRGTSSGSETLLTTVGNVTTFTDNTAANGTTYFYEVSAVNSVGEGNQSNELSATPAATTSSTIASDTFSRTVSAGFGTADVGGAWSVSNTGRTKVDGSQGAIFGWTAGNQDVQAWLPSLTRANTETLAEVTLNATNPTGASYQARVVARAQADARNGYYARIVHTTSGAVTWGLNRIDNAGGTGSLSLGGGTLLASGGAGTKWWIRLRVQGTSIEARFWRDGTTEPSTWTVSKTDSYWASGVPALGVYLNSGATSPFPSIGFDNLTVVDLGP
jgi:CSLREA domain-containing protein